MSVSSSASSLRQRRTYLPAEERRAEILRHALGVFAERGYHAASIGDICARAGIGRATLYQYFEDKRAVLVALAEGIADRVVRAVQERPPLSFDGTPHVSEAQMVRFVERRLLHVLQVLYADPPTTRLVLRAARGVDGVVDEVLRSLDAAILGRLEDELRAGVAAGWLRPLDAAFVARFFLGGVQKTLLDAIEEGRALDLAGLAREITLLELFGVRRLQLAELPPSPPQRPEE